MKYIFGILLIMFISCSEMEEQRDNNLIFFKSTFLAELGNDDYEKMLAKTKAKINAKYTDFSGNTKTQIYD